MHVCHMVTKKIVVSTRILWPPFVQPANWPNICWVLSVLLVTEETTTNRTVSARKSLAVWLVEQIDRWAVASWWWVSCKSRRLGKHAVPSCVDAAPYWPGLPFTWVFSSFKHFKVLTAYSRQKNSGRISRKLSKEKLCFLSLSKNNFLEVNFLLLCFLRYFISQCHYISPFIMLFLSLLSLVK